MKVHDTISESKPLSDQQRLTITLNARGIWWLYNQIATSFMGAKAWCIEWYIEIWGLEFGNKASVTTS